MGSVVDPSHDGFMQPAAEPSGIPALVRALCAMVRFILLRWETEFTPCTGITAVTRQERRHIKNALMIAPWCPLLGRQQALPNDAVVNTGWQFAFAGGLTCYVHATPPDSLMPVLYIEVPGHFKGLASPYDVAEEALSHDALIFGLAVERLLELLGYPGRVLWGADWECVPALVLLRTRYDTAVTIHNVFDRSLHTAAISYGTIYDCFQQASSAHTGSKTALEVGIEAADTVMTVNPGFARGLRMERLHRDVTADHLQHLLSRVVGVTNGPFSPLAESTVALRSLLLADFASGKARLFALRASALAALPPAVRQCAENRVLVVAMGRRVAQKLHDVLVDTVRSLLAGDPGLPLAVVFATTHGDDGSPARLERIALLQQEFPHNVLTFDGRLSFYPQLMAAADFNCMPSLYEPHGGAFESTIIPIARAVDGLAEQICALAPAGAARIINESGHEPGASPSGFLFREEEPQSQATELFRDLLTQSPTPRNSLFHAMVRALSDVLLQAIECRRHDEDAYARLVLAALERHDAYSWQANWGGVVALVEAARARKLLA